MSEVTVGAPECVFFGNISRECTADQIKEYASTAGPVAGAELARSRRFAYVQFATAAAAEAAVEKLNNVEHMGRPLKVEKSVTPKPKEAREPREPRAPKAAAPAAAAPADSTPATPRFREDRIAVFGLPRSYDFEQFKAMFAECGTIQRARINRGVGRITFSSVAEADAALASNGKELEGRELRVEKERVPTKKAAKPAAAAAPAAAVDATEEEPNTEGKKSRRRRNRKGRGAAAAPAAPATTEKREPAAPRRVRVEGIASTTTSDHLKAHFANCGRITGAKVIRGEHGFVTFEEASECQKALALSGSNLNSATITVTVDSGKRAKRPEAATA